MSGLFECTFSHAPGSYDSNDSNWISCSDYLVLYLNLNSKPHANSFRSESEREREREKPTEPLSSFESFGYCSIIVTLMGHCVRFGKSRLDYEVYALNKPPRFYYNMLILNIMFLFTLVSRKYRCFIINFNMENMVTNIHKNVHKNCSQALRKNRKNASTILLETHRNPVRLCHGLRLNFNWRFWKHGETQGGHKGVAATSKKNRSTYW